MDAHYRPSPEDPIFVSLGMVVLDEVRLANGTILHDVPGGSGLYSTLGARLTDTAAAHPEKVGCFVLAGSDFPDSVEDAIKRWGVTMAIKKDPHRLCTRGLVQYSAEGFTERAFNYTTSPLQPTPNDLDGLPLLRSRAFHFLVPPQRMTAFAMDLAFLRCSSGIASRPLVVWEPAPASCVSANADAHLEAAKFVDVYSPNHTEFLSTFDGGVSRTGFDRDAISEHAIHLVETGIGQDGSGAVVVRCGEHGCLVASKSYPPRWFPPFHSTGSSRVVDATGAGNAFLGAFAVTFAISSNLDEAAIAGSVAASFLTEQVGLPDRTSRDGRETWNGETFLDRVDKYRAMLNTHGRV